MFVNKIRLRVQNMIIILGLIVNVIGGGELIWSFIEHDNLHFDNDKNIHMSTKDYEKSNYDFSLNLVTILY